MLFSFFLISSAWGQMAPIGFSTKPPIAWIQSSPKQKGAGVTTLTTTFAALPKAGNTIILYVANWAGNLPSVTDANVSDNNGNTYQTACTNSGVISSANLTTAIFYAKNIVVNQPTFAVTAVSAGGPILDSMILASEYAGLDKTAPADQQVANSNNTPSATATSNSTPTTQAHFSLLAAVIQMGSGSVTALANTSGFNSRFNDIVGTTGSEGEGGEKLVSGTTTYSSSWSITGTDTMQSCLATFK